MSSAPHPADGELAEFVLGKLSDANDADVERHLTDCPYCQARAAAANPDDTLLAIIAAVGTRADAARTLPPTSAATPADFIRTRLWEHVTEAEGRPEGLADHPRYRLVRLLGQGGMGVVWLAEHTVMGRMVALKVIHPALLSRSGAVARFRREVRAAARLSHPNLVPAYDADEAGGSHFLVMEYVPGETLLDVLGRGPLPVAEAGRAARDAARGLAHAHAAGLVHRDVKPGNLIRAADGAVKVLDFGLVAIGATDDGLTGENVVMGTPDYIAPEQAEDATTADARSDVYALGCTLYHLLTGRVPYPTASTLRKLDAHRDPAVAPDPVAGVPPRLTVVLAKMLATNPADRYQSAGEAADALDRFLAEPDDAPVPVKRSWRRGPWAAASLLALATVVAVALTIPQKDTPVTIPTDDGPLPAAEELLRIPFASAGWQDFAADGTEFLAQTVQDGKRMAVIFDTATGKETSRFLTPPGEYVLTRFIPGSRDLLVSADLKLSRWDRTTGTKRADLFALPPNTTVTPLPPTGDLVAVFQRRASGWDRHRVIVYDLRTQAVRFRVDPLGPQTVLGDWPRFSPDGTRFVTTDVGPEEGVVRVWKTGTGELERTIKVPGTLGGAEFAEGPGRIIAAYHPHNRPMMESVRWDLVADAKLGAAALNAGVTEDRSTFLPTGRVALFQIEKETATRFVATTTGQVIAEYRPGGVVRSATPSADGRFVLYATDAGLRVVRVPSADGNGAADRNALLAVTDFREAHGLDLSALRRWIDELPAGHRPTDIAARSGALPPRFDAIAVRDGSAPPFEAHLDLDRTAVYHMTDFRTMNRDGWGLRVSCPYEDWVGRPRHHVWVKDGSPWFAYGFALREIADEIHYWKRERRRPRIAYLNAADTGKKQPNRPMCVLCGPDDGLPWEFVPELTGAELAAKLAETRGRGWRPDCLGQMGAGADRTFALSVVSNPTGLAWEFKAGLSEQDYATATAGQKKLGRRPLAVASVQEGDQVRYTGVWIEYTPGKSSA